MKKYLPFLILALGLSPLSAFAATATTTCSYEHPMMPYIPSSGAAWKYRELLPGSPITAPSDWGAESSQALTFASSTCVTTVPDATSTPSGGGNYNGPDTMEWLFVSCVGLFFGSMGVWGNIFKLI